MMITRMVVPIDDYSIPIIKAIYEYSPTLDKIKKEVHMRV